MPPTSVPKLQQKLFKRMGIDVPDPNQGSKPRSGRGNLPSVSRKDDRKAQRAQRKAHRYSRQPSLVDTDTAQGRRSTATLQTTEPRAPTRQPILAANSQVDDDDESLSEEHDEENHSKPERPSEGSALPSSRGVPGAGVSRIVRERLAQDDAEIEELEKKLGIKRGRKSLPQAFKDDGLGDLLDELGGDVERSDDDSKKRKLAYDEWLSSKRRKTVSRSHDDVVEQDECDEDGVDAEDVLGVLEGDVASDAQDDATDNDESVEEGGEGTDDESFRSFDSAVEDAVPSRRRQRENPYVAPTTGTVAKYVPPSLRKTSASEDETKSRLRKQIQGQINRLTDTNILSIVQSIDGIYQTNARGDVTEILVDAIMAQISKPESLPDQFFVLTGGFAAAIYKTTGSSFGSHLIRRVVKDFGQEYENESKRVSYQSAIRKEASNMITFLTQLYIFEVVSCKIVFDYMERLLEQLSELNVELLLRICRMAGRLLRRDDSQSVKHVAEALSNAVSKVGGFANVSARTKFMIETINDLKNSKTKAKGIDSTVVSEHVLRMKKRLGELKSQSRRLDGLAPMGMGLDDVEGADTHGKWWLVGASVPAYRESAERAKKRATSKNGGHEDSADDEDMDFVLPDYPKKARAQGFSTTAQIAIFTAIMSAKDHEHGYRQYANLKLKKDGQLEIARVLVQCVGSEIEYNEYYALVGRQACANSRVRFAFQDRLWKLFRGLGESLFGEEAGDEETADSEKMKDPRRASNVAHFYASLVADGALSINILKPLQLPEVNSWTSSFVEGFMLGLLRACKGKGSDEDASVERVFGPARELPSLAAGTHWFLRKKLRKSKLSEVKEVRRLDRVREKAQAVVQAMAMEG